MIDIFGNEVVLGRTYVVCVGALNEKNNTNVIGKAVKVLKGAKGDKITLELYRVECYADGQRSGLEVYGDKGPKSSFYPHRLIPLPGQV